MNEPEFNHYLRDKLVIMTINRLFKLPNYIKSFGLFHGLRVFFETKQSLRKSSNEVKSYMIPGYSNPIFLRNSISDHSIFWQCIINKQYDFFLFEQSKRLMDEYHQLVSRNITPLIIDCGGNIGLATLYLATKLPHAKICVIEPDQDNFEMIKKNTSFLGNRVVPIHGGVWSESAILRITNPDSGSAAFRVGATQELEDRSIRAYTIDEICNLAESSSPLVVKIDIEGAQLNLFQKNTDWVRKTQLIMLELDDWLMPWQGTSRPFFSCVSRDPFDYLISGETIFCFRDFLVAAQKT